MKTNVNRLRIKEYDGSSVNLLLMPFCFEYKGYIHVLFTCGNKLINYSWFKAKGVQS